MGTQPIIFAAQSSGGLVGNFASYSFEVSNGGAGSDADRDEIHSKGIQESGAAQTFKRVVAYNGIHLLRCRVRDHASKQQAQDMFVVHGY